jgi:uncharacterized membrane protein
MPRISIAVFCALVGLAACAEDPPLCEEKEPEGTPTGSMCGGSTLTYENFGEAFMEKYCTRCHSSSVEGEARNCAPTDHNFDTLNEIVLYRDHIDETTAAGPAAVNESMPPTGAKPTGEERRNLGIWLACEEDKLPPP